MRVKSLPMRMSTLAILLIALTAYGSGCVFSPQTARQAASGVGVQRVEITARQWEFTPKEVRVTVNAPVQLVVTSIDVDHGIEFTDLDVPAERIQAGRSVTIKFIPNKAGTFHFRCSVLCGLGHDQMQGTLIVE